MGFLAGALSPLLTAATQAAGGIQEGKLQAIAEKLRQDHQAKQEALAQALGDANTAHLKAETDALTHPKPVYDSTRAVTVDPVAGTSKPVAGIEPTPKAPLPGSPEDLEAVRAHAIINAKAQNEYGYHAPVQPRNIDPLSPQGIQAQAQVAAQKNGKGATSNLPAPLAAKVGQFGEMLKKASDLMPATDALNVSLGNSAGQDIATHGVGIGSARIPGTQGVGSMMVNHSPEYARYQAALSPFVLAAAHALSGARINDTQVQQIRASIEIRPGESKESREQKHKNLIDLINSIGGSLPGDAIGAQEDQMDANAMTLLGGMGYKKAIRSGASPAGGGPPPAPPKPKLTQAQYEAGLQQGNTDAEIASHYDLSGVKRHTK